MNLLKIYFGIVGIGALILVLYVAYEIITAAAKVLPP